MPFDNTYAALGDRFSTRQLPTPVKQPGLIRFNRDFAEFLGLDCDALSSPRYVDVWAGNGLPEGAEPVATVYGGHQFGSWNPQLGDGRAILLGEIVARDRWRYDIQLKGSGETPYSRMGDGRSPLGPVLREYIVSEAMAALGVPTTRSLAATTTGEYVFRNGPEPGAVLTRVASSHIRVGTFQYFAARGENDAVRTLADYIIDRHYPETRDRDNPYLELLNSVIERQALLIARWQSFGFIHGVMNTDNMLICGETVDYGPCAFMDQYHPDTVFSSIDRQGRYAFRNQPVIAQWNLMWFAQSILPILAEKEDDAVQLAQDAINRFNDLYSEAWQSQIQGKIGFDSACPRGQILAERLLALMAENDLDFTLTFRSLADSLSAVHTEQSIADIYPLPSTLEAWRSEWQGELAAHNSLEEAQRRMYSCNPVFIPRNHLVEEAIAAAVREKDFGPFHALVDLTGAPIRPNKSPFNFDAGFSRYALPPTPEEVVTQTFCGT